MPELVRARIRVFGRVQGVFFRKCTRDKANKIGELCGYVRNARDGSVEIVAEGEKPRIESLVKWCRSEGSPWSRVQGVEVDWEQPQGDLQGFRITY
ncbi:MAG: acylphosphatase [Candidatus Hodarchaeales archaeon]|jgi:acylphosphatase